MQDFKTAAGSMSSVFSPQQNILETYTCEGCGKEVKVYEMLMNIGPQKGNWVKGKSPCDCEVLEIVRTNQKAARKSRLQTIFESNSLINQSLQKASFENFDQSAFEDGYKRAVNYAENFSLENPRNLFFQGSFGTGKSHLSVSIAKEVINNGFTAIFISTPKLLTKIRNTYNKNSEHGEEDILREIADADLVIFDDVGAESDIKGWAMGKLFEAIDSRSGKNNVYTTNLSSKDFDESRDLQRLFSRMLDNSEPIIMNGTDYRKKHFVKSS